MSEQATSLDPQLQLAELKSRLQEASDRLKPLRGHL